MTMIPSHADVEAGFTEVLTAVAVFHGEREPWAKVPWAHAADAGFQLPGEVWNWLRRLDGWERKIEYVLYLVPEAEYVPLNELRLGGPQELGSFDFLATPEEVAVVRAGMANTTEGPQS